jgi:hypothetical protein
MTKKENEGEKENRVSGRKQSSPDLKGNSWGSARFGCVSPVVDLGV